MESSKKITIIDVAEKAGVSKGTVDRVIHNRGEVSARSTAKVRKAIRELNYEPNLYASLLASRQGRVIACLFPKSDKGEYWTMLLDGFIKGGEDAAPLNVTVSVFTYDQYSPDSFLEASEMLLGSNPSGVVIAPLFKDLTLSFAERLVQEGIPYVYVDTKLDDGHYLAYFGMPMYKSGRLCARMLTDRLPQGVVDDVLVVRILRDDRNQSDPTKARRDGFNQYMAEHYPDAVIHSIFVDPKDPVQRVAVMDSFFASHPDVRYVVMFNSRVHLISDYLKEHHLDGRIVVGFDSLEKNMEALRSGAVTILISQHTEYQSQYAVRTLVDHVLMRKDPARRDNFMHMDILLDINQENYQSI